MKIDPPLEIIHPCRGGITKEKLGLLDAQIAEVDCGLGKLHDALETGEFKGGELAFTN